jgi:hypothetical protein
MQSEIKRTVIWLASGFDLPESLGVDSKKVVYREFNNWKANKPVRYSAQPDHIRYCDLNLHSWYYRGTLEFRLKEGTVTSKEIVGWPLLCLWLVEAVGNTTGRDMPKCMEDFERWFEKRTPAWLWSGYIRKGPHF